MAEKRVPFTFVEEQEHKAIVHVVIFLEGKAFKVEESTENDIPVYIYTELENETQTGYQNQVHEINHSGSIPENTICILHVDKKDRKRRTKVIYKSPISGGGVVIRE